MDLYKDIIRETVEKYVLKENVGNIGSYINILKRLLTELSQYDSSNDDRRVNNFLERLDYYTIQIIFAIDRCVKANSLNERFSFRDLGIEIPPELGGNLWNDMKDSYYKTQRFLNGLRGGRGGSSSYAKGQKGNVNNPNSVKTERLSVLLSYLPKYENWFRQLNNNFGIDQKTQAPHNILMELNNLQVDYNNAINAQGTNP